MAPHSFTPVPLSDDAARLLLNRDLTPFSKPLYTSETHRIPLPNVALFLSFSSLLLYVIVHNSHPILSPSRALLGPACHAPVSTTRLLLFDTFSPNTSLGTPDLPVQDAATFAALRLAQELDLALHGPFLSPTGLFTTGIAPALHFTALYNASRVFRFFRSACLSADPALARLRCTPFNTVLVCMGNEAECRKNPLARALAPRMAVTVPGKEAALGKFAYRSKEIQEAGCVLVVGYDLASVKEAEMCRAFIANHGKEPAIDQTLLPASLAQKRGLNISTKSLEKARRAFKAHPERVWKELAESKRFEGELAKAAGGSKPRGVLVLDERWDAAANESCSLVGMAKVLRKRVEDVSTGGPLAVVKGELFAGKEDNLRVLHSAFERGNGTVRLLDGTLPQSVLLNQLLAQEVVASAADCIHVLRGNDKEVSDFVDVFRFERELPPCKKLLFEEKDCAYRVDR